MRDFLLYNDHRKVFEVKFNKKSEYLELLGRRQDQKKGLFLKVDCQDYETPHRPDVCPSMVRSVIVILGTFDS